VWAWLGGMERKEAVIRFEDGRGGNRQLKSENGKDGKRVGLSWGRVWQLGDVLRHCGHGGVQRE